MRARKMVSRSMGAGARCQVVAHVDCRTWWLARLVLLVSVAERERISRGVSTLSSFFFFFFAFIPLFVLGPSKLAKSCEKTPLFGCLMVTALPGPAALRTLWLPHGNGFALVLFFFAMETHCAEH